MDSQYDTLLNTFKRMYELVDAFHFNSQNTRDVYERYLEIPSKSTVVAITHSGIQDRRKEKKFKSKILQLGFVGSEAPYKGLPILKKVITAINNDGLKDNVLLSVYGGKSGVDDNLPNVLYKGRFGSDQIEEIYGSMDLLIVPSICYETFSLTALEALQFGVPVAVSNTVGAKDIVSQYSPQFVFSSFEELLWLIKSLIKNRDELVEYNQKVIHSEWKWSMEHHSKEIIDRFYY